MKKVAIIGANGYVGEHLTKLLALQHDVTGIVRNECSIFKPVTGVHYCNYLNLPTTDFDIIINTAYSRSADKSRCQQENEQMLALIKKLMVKSTQLIHLSTLAVFGVNLDIAQSSRPIPNRTDFPYVMSKLHMENLLLSRLNPHQLQILRIGNVWGDANNSWTQPIVDAILYGIPVKHIGNNYSNLTFIHNLTHYISHLINNNTHMLFHHVAELGHISWAYFIDQIAAQLNVEPVLFYDIPFYPKTLQDELAFACGYNPLQTIRNLKAGRFTAITTKKLLATPIFKLLTKLPIHKNKHKITTEPFIVSNDFYWVLGCQTLFKPIVCEKWSNPFDEKDAATNINGWLNTSGYVLQRNQ